MLGQPIEQPPLLKRHSCVSTTFTPALHFAGLYFVIICSVGIAQVYGRHQLHSGVPLKPGGSYRTFSENCWLMRGTGGFLLWQFILVCYNFGNNKHEIILFLCILESDNCFVSLEPRQFIGVPGTNFVYTCSTTFGPRASSAEWFLNGQMFNESIPDINFYSSSARVYYLEIANASLNFNNTNIMCSLTVNERVCNSNVSILQLQG